MKSLRERKEKPISMMTDVKINANERIDDLCRDNLKLIQNTEVFCFGMDAVCELIGGWVENGEYPNDEKALP